MWGGALIYSTWAETGDNLDLQLVMGRGHLGASAGPSAPPLPFYGQQRDLQKKTLPPPRASCPSVHCNTWAWAATLSVCDPAAPAWNAPPNRHAGPFCH